MPLSTPWNMSMIVVMITNDTTFAWNLRKEVLFEFIKHNYKVILIAKVLGFKEEFEIEGIKVIDVDNNRRGTNPFADVALLSSYIKILKKEKPNIVFTNSIKPNIYAGIACQLLRISYVSNITGLGTALENSGFIRRISMSLYKIGIKKTKTVFFQNEYNHNFFVKHRMLPKNSNIIILPGSGVNLEEFRYSTYPERNSPMVFSTIGRIMKDKGIDELLFAVRIVKNEFPNTIFRLIGSFDENYQDIVKRAEEDGLIEYYDNQPDIRPFLQASFAIIHPSHHEGMSNILLESAATGRPVIASNTFGCKETFVEGESGFGFQVKNGNDLSKKIIEFINLPYEKKKEMGIAGREWVKNSFDRNIVIKEYFKQI